MINNIRANGIEIELDEQMEQITIDFHGKKMAVLTVDEFETLYKLAGIISNNNELYRFTTEFKQEQERIKAQPNRLWGGINPV